MNCNDCPHETNGKCCHESIKPTIKPSASVGMSEEILERMKAQYDEAYEYYGDCYDD